MEKNFNRTRIYSKEDLKTGDKEFDDSLKKSLNWKKLKKLNIKQFLIEDWQEFQHA